MLARDHSRGAHLLRSLSLALLAGTSPLGCRATATTPASAPSAGAPSAAVPSGGVPSEASFGAAAPTVAAQSPAPTGAGAATTAALADEPCPRDPEPAGSRQPIPAAGYDRWLTGYAYPYEVRRRPLEVQGLSLCMAYMDVQPAEPNGHVVLLLHGKNFSGAYWQATAEALLARGYRVVMPDQIGFGKSSKPTAIQYSFSLLARSTSLLLDALGVERASVVGHSMGGMLAVRWATQYPERTDHLVLVNPIGLEDYRRTLPYLGVDAWSAQTERQGPPEIKSYMQRSYFHDAWQPTYDPLLDIQVGWATGPRSRAAGEGLCLDARHALHAARGLRAAVRARAHAARDRPSR